MRKVIMVLMLLVTIPVFGQTHSIGFRGGINITKVYLDSDYYANTHHQFGVNSGLTYEYKFNKRFSIGADLIYNQKGWEGDLEGIYHTSPNFDYLSLPIKSGFTWGKKVAVFVNLGIVPSVLLEAQSIFEGFGNDEFIDRFTDEIQRFDFSGMIEIGGAYKLEEELLVFTSFAYQQSFTRINKENYSGLPKHYHYAMAISVGLKHILSTKK